MHAVVYMDCLIAVQSAIASAMLMPVCTMKLLPNDILASIFTAYTKVVVSASTVRSLIVLYCSKSQRWLHIIRQA